MGAECLVQIVLMAPCGYGFRRRHHPHCGRFSENQTEVNLSNIDKCLDVRQPTMRVYTCRRKSTWLRNVNKVCAAVRLGVCVCVNGNVKTGKVTDRFVLALCSLFSGVHVRRVGDDVLMAEREHTVHVCVCV